MASWQEAVLEQIDLEGDYVKVGDGASIFAVRSKTDDMDFYYIIDLGWNVVCAKCKGFRFRSDCQHVRDYLDKKDGGKGLTLVPDP